MRLAPRFVHDAATGESVDAETFERRTADAADQLAAQGVGRGDHVVLSRSPSLATVVLYAALRRMGAVVVPANTSYTPPELDHVVSDVRATLVVDDTWEPRGRANAELDVGAPDDPAMIAYTSGTTGRPKGAVLTNRNLDAGAASVVEAWRWTHDDVLVLALPLFHMHGLGVGLNGTLAAGSGLVVLPRFEVDAVLDAIRDHDATMFFGVPTMWARLAASPRVSELGRLRLAVSGSAPLPPSLWRTLEERAGVQVLERYGMSETVMLASNPYDGPRVPGTVGVPLPGVDIRLGGGGAVEVRGPNVFSGYWQRPEATREAFTDDGWFRTGDIGAYDGESGHLTLVGRTSELIITGGFNVYPREVEDALRTHNAVADVCVVGVPDDEWGEVVTAFVVLSSEAGVESFAAHLSDRLAPYKRPRRWRFVSELPRNAMGKVLRAELEARES